MPVSPDRKRMSGRLLTHRAWRSPRKRRCIGSRLQSRPPDNSNSRWSATRSSSPTRGGRCSRCITTSCRRRMCSPWRGRGVRRRKRGLRARCLGLMVNLATSNGEGREHRGDPGQGCSRTRISWATTTTAKTMETTPASPTAWFLKFEFFLLFLIMLS
jgi:hypothetical protein